MRQDWSGHLMNSMYGGETAAAAANFALPGPRP
jgi:hypothetical protein